jgi:hypothetical protein
MDPDDSYVLGRSDAEPRRLVIQNQIYGPITRRSLQAAGIGAGLKVLEVDIDTLAGPLREDVTSRQAVQMLPIIYGASARTRP